jgi:hypothetical protein
MLQMSILDCRYAEFIWKWNTISLKDCHYKPYRRRRKLRYSSYSSMTSVLDGVSGQRQARADFYPGKSTPSRETWGTLEQKSCVFINLPTYSVYFAETFFYMKCNILLTFLVH